jgi:hypothetical protein
MLMLIYLHLYKLNRLLLKEIKLTVYKIKSILGFNL